jgi:hypothetical protein
VPVILHLESEQEKVKYPFKFNSIWLQDPELVNFVRNHWNGILGTEVLNPMDSLTKKLKILKGLVIKWERKKKIAARGELIKIEEELGVLYTNNPGGFEKEEDKDIVIEKKEKIDSFEAGGGNLEAEE